jgi:cell division protein FtsB
MEAFSVRSFWFPVLLTTLVAAFFGAFLARRGREFDRMLDRQVRQEAALRVLEEQNERLRAQRRALMSSPEAIERVAREDFGFAAPGERVESYRASGPATPGHAAPRRSRPLLHAVLIWDGFPLAFPAAVFVLTALVFAIANVIAVRGHRESVVDGED